MNNHLAQLPLTLARNVATGFLCFLLPSGLAQAQEPTTPKETTQAPSITTQNTITRRTIYEGRDAYEIIHGSLRAVVVPSLGRVMHFGFVGGENRLWTNAAPRVPPAGAPFWLNWGGDKTWLAPQNGWGQGKGWPPAPAWDGKPHTVEMLPNHVLRLTSGVWPEFGVRLTRDYSFNGEGEFVIAQTVEKVSGEARMLSIWSVTQVPPADAVFLPLNPRSAYKQDFHWISRAGDAADVVQTTSSLLLARPSALGSYKIGCDAPLSAIASVREGVAFVLHAAQPQVKTKDIYPDGAPGAGFPVELFDSGPLRKRYLELELFSPMRPFRVGQRWTHSVCWNLHRLSSKDVTSPQVQEEVRRLLLSP